ncbi:MAG: PadR family transcriptional regulator [Promethearchaeota archaeon]
MAFPPFFQRPKGALLRISILRIISDEPLHGYEIMKRIEEDTEGRWSPSHSLLYNTLGQLEEQGFITSQKDYKGEVERTVYSITQEGNRKLDEEVSQIAQMISRMMSSFEGRRIGRFPLLILEHLPPKDRKDLLIKFRDQIQVVLEEIKKELTKIKD